MSNLYTVEKILMRRTNPATGEVEYKVKWQGYSYAQCTWEPFCHLQYVADMVQEFNQSHQNQQNQQSQSKKYRGTQEESQKRGHTKGIRKERREEKSGKGRKRKEKEESDSSGDEDRLKNEEKMNEDKGSVGRQGKNEERRAVLKEETQLEKPSVQIAAQPKYPKPQLDQMPQQLSNNEESHHMDPSESRARSSASSVYSDLTNELEVLEVMQQGSEKELFFQVRLAQEIRWMSHETMKRRYPLELINYYEKFITFTCGQ